MTISNLGEAWNSLERIYATSEPTEIFLYSSVRSDPYEKWRRATKALFRHVGFDRPFWSDFAREATKLSLIIHNSPISPADPYCQGILDANIRLKSYKQGLQSDGTQLLDEFWASLTILRKICVSPYIQWLLDTNDPASDCHLVVYKSDWLRPAKKAIRSKPPLRHISVVPASSLIEPQRLETVFVCGALSLFPSSIYSAGRADRVLWSIFNWMKPFFPDQNPSLYENVQFEPSLMLMSPDEPDQVSDLEESVDTSGLWRMPTSLQAEEQEDEVDDLELVDAVPLILANGAQTFVPFFDRIQVAYPQDSTVSDSISLGKKVGADISVDDFVILRYYGETDIIVLLADEHLGKRAHALRMSQQDWKAKLRNRVAATSLTSALESLKELGSTIANEQNLRNWMSPRNIRTQDREEFRCILGFCGLGDESERIWNEMGEIMRAHTRAGRMLKSQLARELTAHTGSELLSQQRIDVSLPGISSGTLIAIKVQQIGEPRTVRENRLLRIIEPWQN